MISTEKPMNIDDYEERCKVLDTYHPGWKTKSIMKTDEEIFGILDKHNIEYKSVDGCLYMNVRDLGRVCRTRRNNISEGNLWDIGIKTKLFKYPPKNAGGQYKYRTFISFFEFKRLWAFSFKDKVNNLGYEFGFGTDTQEEIIRRGLMPYYYLPYEHYRSPGP